jgi:hypothetical protein
MDQAFPHQVPVLVVGAMAGQKAPSCGESGVGLDQGPDADQCRLWLKMYIGQLGFLKVPPWLREGVTLGGPAAMGRKVGPQEGHVGRVGGGSRSPAWGA